MIFVQRAHHVSREETELWLSEQLAALRGDGIERVQLRRLASPALRFGDTWSWLVEVECRDERSARDAVVQGAGLMLLSDLRLLGMRPSVALLEEVS